MKSIWIIVAVVAIVILLASCEQVKREGTITIIDANTVVYRGHRMALKYSDGTRTVEVDAREEGIIEGVMKLMFPWLMMKD